ncbi:hypothetical protein Tco_0980133 [Tanacetum coccineum]
MMTRSFLPMFITKICPLLTTLDDDEIAPRRNAFLSFKFLDKYLLTTRTMDDEDAPGLKAVLTFQVPASLFLMKLTHDMSNPVSVMDFPSDNDTSMDDEDDDSSMFHNRHSVPQLEPVRFDDRIAQSESSTQTCLEHAQEDDQVEKKAMTLLQLTKSTVSSHHFMKHESVESLLLAFFKEKMINEHVSDSEMLHVAKDWMDEQKMFLDWGCEDDKITCIREMEKTFRWSKYGDELEKENLVSELEDEIFSSLVDDILLDFQMTTVDDDEIAPRRNTVLSFKVLDKNMLTTRTMDDEDAPGLKAVLTFHVPDEVAHEDVDSFDDRYTQSNPHTNIALDMGQEDDQVEKKAMTLLQLTKSTVSSHHFMKHESVESLLLEFFKEKMINEHVSDSEIMEKTFRWSKYGDELEKENLVSELEDEIFSSLVDDILLDFQMTTVDDDEIAPRRNAVLSFKVPDKNLLTARTMDDEDAPRLKAVLTFQVPDEVAHENVYNKCLNDKEEQCSLVLVMDFPSDNDTSMDDEDDDFSTFHNRHVHVEERKLMHKTRRFESVPQLEPVRFEDRIAQSESSTQTCLEHAQEDDQVEKKAMTLLELTKSMVSSHHFMKHESVESLLLAFFKVKMINEHVYDSEMLHVAKDWMDEQKMFLDWGCEDDKKYYKKAGDSHTNTKKY